MAGIKKFNKQDSLQALPTTYRPGHPRKFNPGIINPATNWPNLDPRAVPDNPIAANATKPMRAAYRMAMLAVNRGVRAQGCSRREPPPGHNPRKTYFVHCFVIRTVLENGEIPFKECCDCHFANDGQNYRCGAVPLQPQPTPSDSVQSPIRRDAPSPTVYETPDPVPTPRKNPLKRTRSKRDGRHGSRMQATPGSDESTGEGLDPVRYQRTIERSRSIMSARSRSRVPQGNGGNQDGGDTRVSPITVETPPRAVSRAADRGRREDSIDMKDQIALRVTETIRGLQGMYEKKPAQEVGGAIASVLRKIAGLVENEAAGIDEDRIEGIFKRFKR